MAHAADVIDKRDPSNEMHRQLQPNKTKEKAVLAFYIAEKDVLPVLHYQQDGAL